MWVCEFDFYCLDNYFILSSVLSGFVVVSLRSLGLDVTRLFSNIQDCCFILMQPFFSVYIMFFRSSVFPFIISTSVYHCLLLNDCRQVRDQQCHSS